MAPIGRVFPPLNDPSLSAAARADDLAGAAFTGVVAHTGVEASSCWWRASCTGLRGQGAGSLPEAVRRLSRGGGGGCGALRPTTSAPGCSETLQT